MGVPIIVITLVVAFNLGFVCGATWLSVARSRRQDHRAGPLAPPATMHGR